MATFPLFPLLPAEMKLQIVRKCLPTAYVRLRKANSQIDDFCEDNRHLTGIYLRKEPTIHLTDTLSDLPRNFRDDKWPEEEINGFYVAVYYGKNYWDMNILMPMNRENISVLRESISGFHFERIIVHNHRHIEPNNPDDLLSVEIFNHAFATFLEVVEDQNPGIYDVENVSTDQLDELVELFDIPEVFISPTMKEISSGVDEILKEAIDMKITWYPLDATKVVPYLLNKERVEIDFPAGAEKLWEMVGAVLKNMRNDQIVDLEHFKFTFRLDPNFYDVDLEVNPGALSPCNFIFWHRYDAFPTPFGFKTSRTDLFIFYVPVPEEEAEIPFLIKVRRELVHPHTRVEIHITLLYDEDEEPREEALCLFLDEITISNGYPLDLVDIHAEFKEDEPEEILRNTVEKLFDRQVAAEGWKYRRSPLNVLHEIVTRFWEGPSWILQLRREESLTGRSLIRDYARVIYQEVICPISQYCTFSPK